MRKRVVIIGIIILVIGIALIAVGAIGALRGVTIINTFTQQQSGMFVSSEIVLNSSSIIVVTSPPAQGGLVSASNLTLVNSSSIGRYALPYLTASSSSQTYRKLTGDYYYVAFSSTAPNSNIVVTGASAGIVAFGLLSLAGLGLIIIGIIVAIVGVILKKKRLPQDDTNFSTNNQNTTFPPAPNVK